LFLKTKCNVMDIQHCYTINMGAGNDMLQAQHATV